MKCSGWGMYPRHDCEYVKLMDERSTQDIVKNHEPLIPCGNHRSYGDSMLAESILDARPYDYFLDFNVKTGLLKVQSGVLLSDILQAFVNKGWFLKVTPGTKLITVGGAIASDVHGKNHHIEGCFSECVKEMKIMLQDGSIVKCSRLEKPELFKATCGGMGLTGIILEAEIALKKINSVHIKQTTTKTKNLAETFDVFEEHRHTPYSVAWIDCLARDEHIGRSLLMTGDFMNDGKLNYKSKKSINIPFNFPGFTLNKLTVKAFNWAYYNKVRRKKSTKTVDIDSFFYPLDAVGNWNRIYGKKGFTQYQFILPKERSFDGLKEILMAISASGKGSFLAVLKLYGPANNNYLSFPLEGYSLALDFKIEAGIFKLLDQLDEIVLKYDGRIYLTKDVRVSKRVFEKGYPQINTFREFRKANNMDAKFQSLQSQRVMI